MLAHFKHQFSLTVLRNIFKKYYTLVIQSFILPDESAFKVFINTTVIILKMYIFTSFKNTFVIYNLSQIFFIHIHHSNEVS